MKEIKKYYKVCCCLKGRFFSNIVDNANIKIEYKIGEWSYPQIENSKLFVFDTEYGAKSFACCNLYSLVFECEVTNPVLLQYKQICDFRSEHLYLTFWEHKGDKPKLQTEANFREYSFMFPPDGTVLVDAVKLIKEVSR